MDRLGGETARKRQLEGEAGLPGQQKELLSITSQLQTLAKETQAIPLEIQQEAAGMGVTAGGVAPIQADRIRRNAIKSLGLAAVGQTIQGNISLAQAQVQSQIDAEFEPKKNEIAILQKAYDMNKDALERFDRKRADQLNVLIQERNRDLQYKHEDKSTASAMAMAAIQNNPNNPLAQQAAQRVMSLDINDPDYLSKAVTLIAPYQVNPMETTAKALALDIQREQLKALRQDPGVKTEWKELPDGSLALLNSKDGSVIKQYSMPAGMSGLAPEIQKEVDKQNALDAQTVTGSYDIITGILNKAGVTNIDNFTEKDADKLTDIQIDSIAKALARMQNPDIARAGGDPGNALSPQSLTEKTSQFFRQTVGGKQYLPSKVVDAVKAAVQINKARGFADTIVITD
jgi:hypothetical protein